MESHRDTHLVGISSARRGGAREVNVCSRITPSFMKTHSTAVCRRFVGLSRGRCRLFLRGQEARSSRWKKGIRKGGGVESEGVVGRSHMRKQWHCNLPGVTQESESLRWHCVIEAWARLNHAHENMQFAPHWYPSQGKPCWAHGPMGPGPGPCAQAMPSFISRDKIKWLPFPIFLGHLGPELPINRNIVCRKINDVYITLQGFDPKGSSLGKNCGGPI